MAWMSIEKAARKYLHCRPETLRAFVNAGWLAGAHIPTELLGEAEPRRTTLVDTREIDALLLSTAPEVKNTVTACLAEDALKQRKRKYYRELLGQDDEVDECTAM